MKVDKLLILYKPQKIWCDLEVPTCFLWSEMFLLCPNQSKGNLVMFSYTLLCRVCIWNVGRCMWKNFHQLCLTEYDSNSCWGWDNTQFPRSVVTKYCWRAWPQKVTITCVLGRRGRGHWRLMGGHHMMSTDLNMCHSQSSDSTPRVNVTIFTSDSERLLKYKFILCSSEKKKIDLISWQTSVENSIVRWVLRSWYP